MARRWSKEEALTELRALAEQSRALESASPSDTFSQWRHRVLACLRQVLAGDSHYLKEFAVIPWGATPSGIRYTSDPSRAAEVAARMHARKVSEFTARLRHARGLIEAAALEVERLGVSTADADGDLGLDGVRGILKRFHSVAVELRRRRRTDRPTLEVNDEYDVQDLLHALLWIACSDVRPEEPTPSHGGKSARVDFYLPLEETLVEVKKTRRGLTDKEIGDELIVDIERYQKRDDCSRLICFVYDPDRLIRNPTGLVRDLSRDLDGFTVEVMIVQS